MLVELPSVLSYLPTGIDYEFVLVAARIEYRVRVVDMNEDLLPRAHVAQ